MNSVKLLRPVVAALAIGGLAVPGAASATDIDFTQHNPVPAGQIQHLVTDSIQSREGEGTHRRRIENWTATAASRTIVTNMDTGRVTYECGSSGVDWSCYFPDDNVLEHGSGNDPLVNASWRDQAGFWKQNMRLSDYTRVGTAVDLGRPVTIYKYTSKVAFGDDMVPITETFDLDDELGGFIMKNEISSRLTDGTTLAVTTVVTTMETLTSAPVTLGLVARAGAKSKRVTGRRLPAGTSPSSTTKAKPKPKAKHQAKKKRKTTKKPARRR